MAKWCELLFPLYSVEFLNLSDDNNSHQSFPWAPLKAARFTEKQNGLLRHSDVQSNTSDTATVPTRGTFKWWNSCLMNVRFRKVLVEEARLPSRYTGFDSVTGKKNSLVIKGHDGTTHRREWWGRDLWWNLLLREKNHLYQIATFEIYHKKKLSRPISIKPLPFQSPAPLPSWLLPKFRGDPTSLRLKQICTRAVLGRCRVKRRGNWERWKALRHL